MSWKTIFQLSERLFDKHVNHAEKKTNLPPQDIQLPLSGRVGGLLELQKSPFIVAKSLGSLLNIPSETIIKSISRVKIDATNAIIHRYYLNTGDAGFGEQYLQIFSNNNEIIETLFCQHLTRFIPETIEEQALYTGENAQGLGEQTYTLERGLLESIGFDNTTLAQVFGHAEILEFYRELESHKSFIKPIHATEIRIDDASGLLGLEQEVYFMPYARLLADGKTSETLVISLEIVKSKNGDTSKREIHVDFMIGIALDKTRIQII